MYRAFFDGNELLGFPIGALLFFIAVFVAVTVWALKRKTETVDALAQLPLADDTRPSTLARHGETADV